jgi:hypothetical protein
MPDDALPNAEAYRDRLLEHRRTWIRESLSGSHSQARFQDFVLLQQAIEAAQRAVDDETRRRQATDVAS